MSSSSLNLNVKPEDPESDSSSDSSLDPPREEWSSLICLERLAETKKQEKPAAAVSGDICTEYLTLSNSSIFRHPYYNYPAVTDPGIEDALFSNENPTTSHKVNDKDPKEKLFERIKLSFNNDKSVKDLTVIFLEINKEAVDSKKTYLELKEFEDAVKKRTNVLDKCLIEEIVKVFPGPIRKEFKTVDIEKLADFVKRKMAESSLPVTISKPKLETIFPEENNKKAKDK